MTPVPDKSLSIKVTIEVNGPPDDVAAWLAQLPQDGPATHVRRTEYEEEWTPERARELVERISPRARQALRHMALASPEPIAFKKLQSRLRTNGVGLGGILASFGFAEKAGIPKPYTVDRGRRIYWVAPAVAPMLLEALDEVD
jgi:hypothetical protein